MLSERHLQLLSAYVDGEMSSRQREEAESLVMASPEARQLLAELFQNVERLRNLPPRKLEPAFADSVVNALKQRTAPTPVARRRWPAWTRYAVAASVLAVLAGGVWLATRDHSTHQPNIAANQKTPEPDPVATLHDGMVNSVVAGVTEGFAQPLRPERPGTRLAFEDLAKTQPQEVLMVGMAKQTAVHLEFAVTNQRQAVQRLETVLQNKGVEVVVDPQAQATLTKGPARTEYVIYAENIRPDELAAMLYELGTDERARTSIDSLTVSNFTEDDQKNMSRLLGIKRDELETPPVRNKPFPTFIAKEEKKPGGQEATPPSRTGMQETRLAMILTTEARTGKISGELQYFLNERRALQPGALRVMVVVHEA